MRLVTVYYNYKQQSNGHLEVDGKPVGECLYAVTHLRTHRRTDNLKTYGLWSRHMDGRRHKSSGVSDRVYITCGHIRRVRNMSSISNISQ